MKILDPNIKHRFDRNGLCYMDNCKLKYTYIITVNNNQGCYCKKHLSKAEKKGRGAN